MDPSSMKVQPRVMAMEMFLVVIETTITVPMDMGQAMVRAIIDNQQIISNTTMSKFFL